jgi:hypothetical protein
MNSKATHISDNSLSVVGKTCLQYHFIKGKLIHCFLRILCRGNVFTESLPRNERLFRLRYSGFQASCHVIYEMLSYCLRMVKYSTACCKLYMYIGIYIGRINLKLDEYVARTGTK